MTLYDPTATDVTTAPMDAISEAIVNDFNGDPDVLDGVLAATRVSTETACLNTHELLDFDEYRAVAL